MEDRIVKWLKIGLLLMFCFMCIWLISLLVQMGFSLNENLKSWDPLAFCGAVIGGAITWFGIRHTLKKAATDRFMDKYDKQMPVLYTAVDELKFILSLPVFLLFNSEEELSEQDMYHELQKKVTLLENFYNRYLIQFNLLIGIIEWGVIHKIDIRSIRLATIGETKKLLENRKNWEAAILQINLIIETAAAIYTDLLEYKEQMIKKYYALREK